MKGTIALIRDGKFDEDLQLIREPLPFLSFRADLLSPHEDLCQRKEVQERISVMCLKRSRVHYAEQSHWDLTNSGEKRKKIAVIGLALGLMTAYEFRKMGYRATVFEALSVLGVVPAVGIPECRLPRVFCGRRLALSRSQV